jgi:Domain of unknown function (DUF4062)/HEAT repeats/NACHT domain
MARVYVSSTFIDLQDCRERVFKVLRQMGHEDVAMEYYVAEDKRPVDKCLQDVASCDLYVGIFAWRYGWVPKSKNRKKLSITEMEFRQAVLTGKKCLIFVLDSKTAWPPDFIDDDKTKIKKLRAELGDEHGAVPFTSPDHLASQVSVAVRKWEQEHGHIPAATLIPELDLEAYFKALRKRYQRIDLEGLTPPQREEYLQLLLRSVFVEQSVRENPPPVELSKEMWERLRREKEIQSDDLPEGVVLDDLRKAREVYYEKPLRPVLDVLTDSRHQSVVILGDPGSGKSTLSRYVLLSLIDAVGDEKLRRAFDGYLPLLIELRSYMGLRAENKCDTFLQFLEYAGQTEGWHLTASALEHYLKNDGRAVVIFDGLDEIFDPEQREQIMRRVAGFANDYSNVRIIATSRIVGYRRKVLTDADFSHFTLQDLDASQVATFAERWYELALSDRPEDARERRERILRAFRESNSIRQLAGNPMLLTIMAIIAKHQELPRERWKLYDHAANVLIEHWDINKHLRDQNVPAEFIGQDEKKEMLRRLAYRMQSGAGGLAGNYIHRDDLQDEFESYLKERFDHPPDRRTAIARAMTQQFRERNFILVLYDANLYGFVHRAFLEHFCASAFVNRFEKTKEIALDDLKDKVYGAHWEDRNWHEVLRLICSMIDEKFTGEIINYLINNTNQPQPEEYDSRPPWNIALAVQCLSELKNLGLVAEPAKQLLEALCSLFDTRLQRRDTYDKFLQEQIAVSAEAIGPNWTNRTILAGWLRKYQSFNTSWNYADAFGKFIGTIGAGLNEVQQVILEYARHHDGELRFLATYTLPRGWQADPHTLLLLQDCVVNDEQSFVRRAAVSAIVEHYRGDPQTLVLLRKWAINAPHNDVRRAAVSAIVEHYRGDSQALPLLRDLAINARYNDIRSTAVGAIVEHYRGDEQTLPLLREWTINAEDGDVRQAAVRAIIKYYREDEQTLPLLREWAINAKYSDVRNAAMSAIIEHYRGDKQTLTLLREWAINAKYSDVRQAAVRAIIKYYRGDEQTLPLLREWAINAKYSDVRNAAMSAIIEYYRGDEQTLTLLREWAISAEDGDIRQAAVSAMAEHYREDEQTLTLLREWAINAEDGDVRNAAMRAVVKHYRRDERTLPLLRERAMKDADSDVRRAAVSAIIEHYRGDKQTLPLLRAWTAIAKHSDVRRAALRAVVKHYRDDEQTLPLLHERAVKDTDGDVRRTAVSAIIQHYREDEQTLSLLRKCAVEDESPPHDSPSRIKSVRQVAIEVIAKYWPTDPDTLSLLWERAKNDPTVWLRKRAKELADELAAKPSASE